MAQISIMGDSKECPEGFDYVLGCVGRKSDSEDLIKHKPMRRGDIVLFHWDNVTDVEIDRFNMLCKLHDYRIKVGEFDIDRPEALCIRFANKDDIDLFFEVYPEGEAPAVEGPPKLSPADISEIKSQIIEAVEEAKAEIAAKAPSVQPKPNYTVNFFGWCSEEGHDKVWGYLTIGSDTHNRHTELYNFWGKRGKRLAFQKHEGLWGSDELQKRADQKTRSGRSSGSYQRVAPSNIESVVPGFFEELEKQLTLAKLFDNFRNKVDEDA